MAILQIQTKAPSVGKASIDRDQLIILVSFILVSFIILSFLLYVLYYCVVHERRFIILVKEKDPELVHVRQFPGKLSSIKQNLLNFLL